MNPEQQAKWGPIALRLVEGLDRHNPAKTGKEALERLAITVRADYLHMDHDDFPGYYRARARELGLNFEEVRELLGLLYPPLEAKPSDTLEDYVLMLTKSLR